MESEIRELKQALKTEKSIEKKGQLAIEIAWLISQRNIFTNQDAEWFYKL